MSEEDRSDANYAPLRENWEILKQFPVRARKLPMPAPLYFEGQRLPASYANFYIANQMVLVPTFNDPNDRIALNVLAECFPGPASDRDQLRGTGLGPRHAALHDAAATCSWGSVILSAANGTGIGSQGFDRDFERIPGCVRMAP